MDTPLGEGPHNWSALDLTLNVYQTLSEARCSDKETRGYRFSSALDGREAAGRIKNLEDQWEGLSSFSCLSN